MGHWSEYMNIEWYGNQHGGSAYIISEYSGLVDAWTPPYLYVCFKIGDTWRFCAMIGYRGVCGQSEGRVGSLYPRAMYIIAGTPDFEHFLHISKLGVPGVYTPCRISQCFWPIRGPSRESVPEGDVHSRGYTRFRTFALHCVSLGACDWCLVCMPRPVFAASSQARLLRSGH